MASGGASPNNRMCFDYFLPLVEYDFLAYIDVRLLSLENSDSYLGINDNITDITPIVNSYPYTVRGKISPYPTVVIVIIIKYNMS